MNDLRQLLNEHLATLRALGARLVPAGRLLERFVALAIQRKSDFLKVDLAVERATQPSHAQPAQRANRMGIARGFALDAHAADPRHGVPPPGLIPASCRRPAPYLCSDREVTDLLGAARGLSGASGLRPCTCATLPGLLAATGMRTGEPLGLDRDDVDLSTGVLTVRQAKFGKSRHIPAHASTQQALARHAARRDRLCPHPLSAGFFLSERGRRITARALRWRFVKLSGPIGLRGPSDSRGPRLPDLRHRFAVETPLRWYRDGADVERHPPRLATDLGHVHVSDAYRYLAAGPELLRAAGRRLDRTERRPPS